MNPVYMFLLLRFDSDFLYVMIPASLGGNSRGVEHFSRMQIGNEFSLCQHLE